MSHSVVQVSLALRKQEKGIQHESLPAISLEPARASALLLNFSVSPTRDFHPPLLSPLLTPLLLPYLCLMVSHHGRPDPVSAFSKEIETKEDCHQR